MNNELEITQDNIGLIHSRVSAILSIIQDELDINKELAVCIHANLNTAKVDDNIYSVKVDYSNHDTKDEYTLLILLTKYEINDLNILYRYVKNNILYYE